ncbi:Modification methylase BanI [Pandoraea apista]|uniref:Modification methylase BanI n=1 Tax=Pandoraea apista TaxID=93218 RepID=A0A5E5PCI2_9BURK|nr:hypothetical protein [Pandoraea apista]VVG74054.1 Modification methylase BanI [Pandoraea apista]
MRQNEIILGDCRPLRYLSVCSGIEAATCAWHPLGERIESVENMEIEKAA